MTPRDQIRALIAQVGLLDASIRLGTSQIALDVMANHGTPIPRHVEHRLNELTEKEKA